MSDYLNDPDEVLYRHIHPDFFQKGEPSDSRFRPSKQDANKLSVDRSSVHDEAASHYIYTYGGRKSEAIFGVSVSEFKAHNISCVSDPTKAKAATDTSKAELENKAHALADYSAHTEAEQKLISKKLKQLALARGKLYPK
ncbi:hypothetical protein [Massilia sp. CT11-137]|uniref:hypothetical protein n=1 Tax=Massilia sp. CT11-137 TaxID=3393901 RepID=UPI0039A7343A